MTKATYDQAAAIHALLGDTSREQLQLMLSKGLLADLRDGDLENVDREEFRRMLRIKPRHTAAIAHVIDLNAKPFVPEGWKEESHQPGGQFTWDARKVEPHLDDAQLRERFLGTRDPSGLNSVASIEGHKLQKKLAKIAKRLLNANCLDYLLAHPELIPESWKGKATFFWGTIYRCSSVGLYVRCLCWDGRRWFWKGSLLDGSWFSDDPAAVLREC